MAAADRFRSACRWDEAAVALLNAGAPREAAACFEEGGQWLRALQAWESAEEPLELLRAAQSALEGRIGDREATLGFVRRALQALPTPEAVREAALLLGAPRDDASGSHGEVVKFLADQLGAEAAALRLLGSSGSREDSRQRDLLALRAFHRSISSARQPAWEILPDAMSSLAALLYGLHPRDTSPMEGSQQACLKPGGALTCVLIPKASVPNLKRTLTLGDSLEAVLVSLLRQAEGAKRAEERYSNEIVPKGQEHLGRLGRLKDASQLPFLPEPIVQKLALLYARENWWERGPVGPREVIPAGAAAALLACARSAWSDADSFPVETAFAILSAGGEATQDLFLELPGAQKHAALCDYASALRSGHLADAVEALSRYLRSPASTSIASGFLEVLSSFLAGPVTVVAQPTEGTYIMSCLSWDWPSALQASSEFMTSVSLLADALWERSSSAHQHAQNVRKRGGPTRVTGTRTKPSLPTLGPDSTGAEGEIAQDKKDTYSKSAHEWALQLPCPGAALVQLGYTLGWEVEDDWWEEVCWDVYPPAEPVHDADVRARRLQDKQRRDRRLQAGKAIANWAVPKWRARSGQGLWAAICEAGEALRCMKLSPPVRAAELFLAAHGAVQRGCRDSRSALCELTCDCLRREEELRRRAEVTRVQREVERTRDAREEQRELRRRRNQRKNEALQRKAEHLKQVHRGTRL
eukprot:gnl/TRDRNA2_/TRDRNA2_133643_c2_seq1.p1 gnl/TRDRNA2_/TRDRNA2_133643_c2~~gnl/TRDRNA2_/TRDRNA2_133643_c2_seq1.p1  ORF type:complete len:821 (+),score=127.34 gnl/TRDRNA2_/TRDRNA2_133643_c2_seq1:367-2463(+)